MGVDYKKSTYILKDIPDKLKKKYKLLKYFEQHLLGENRKEILSESEFFVKKYMRTNYAYLFRFK